MASHTLGPWRIQHADKPLEQWKHGGYVVEDRAKGDANPDKIIAGVGGMNYPPEVNRANARLISAAPELLAALEELLGEFDESACGAGTSVRIGQARAAIRAARGEA